MFWMINITLIELGLLGLTMGQRLRIPMQILFGIIVVMVVVHRLRLRDVPAPVRARASARERHEC